MRQQKQKLDACLDTAESLSIFWMIHGVQPSFTSQRISGERNLFPCVEEAGSLPIDVYSE
jgi:hypothetical protein